MKIGRKCLHQITHTEDWPDGGAIEICNTCGMSRHLWEQGESSWIMIPDIPSARKEVQESFGRMMRGVL